MNNTKLKFVKPSLWLILLITFSIITNVNGQENVLISGSLDFLKQEKFFNVVFSYESMAVGIFRTESEYTQKKVSELNNLKNGNGDKWLIKWNQRKANDFPQSFLYCLNKKIKKLGLKADTALTNAKYCIIIKPYFMEEGYDVGVSSKPAIVRLQIIVCLTSDKTKQIAEFRITGEYYSGSMLFGGDLAFQEAGKTFGKLLIKSLK